MRRSLILILFSLLVGLSLSAQDFLRYNYRRNGYIYTGAERVRVAGTTPLELKLSRVRFPDAANIYILRVDYEEHTAWKMPVNAPLTINTAAGRTVVLKHASTEPNLVAPDGIERPGGKVYWNYGEYYIEEEDIDKLASGVTGIDAVKRWSSEGHIRVQYKNNEFSSALNRQLEAIKKAPVPTEEIGNNLKMVQDQKGSRLVETVKLNVNDRLSLSLGYLYYAPSNSESYDFNIYVPGYTIPLNAEITVLTSGGSAIILKQEKEMPAGRVLCYPTAEELKAMSRGVSRMTIQTTDAPLTLRFTDGSFASIVDKLYNSLQTASIL